MPQRGRAGGGWAGPWCRCLPAGSAPGTGRDANSLRRRSSCRAELEPAGPGAGGFTDGHGGDESGPRRPFSRTGAREGAGRRGSDSRLRPSRSGPAPPGGVRARPRPKPRRGPPRRPPRRPPGVSHRLAARGPGAPPQRLHVGAGRRPVREHGGERGSRPSRLPPPAPRVPMETGEALRRDVTPSDEAAGLRAVN